MPKIKNLSFTTAIQAATLLVVIGVWVGGIDGLKDQTLIGFESMERQIEINHVVVLNILQDQDIKIEHIEDFLVRKYPKEYVAPITDPYSQAIRRRL